MPRTWKWSPSLCPDCNERYREKGRRFCDPCRDSRRKKRDCKSQSDWRKRNPELARANDRAYKAANREKLIEYGREYIRRPEVRERRRQTQQARRTQFRERLRLIVAFAIRQRGLCGLCHQILPEDIDNLHLDHIEPITSGGVDEPGNMHLTCRSCNLAKGAFTT